MIGVWCNGNTTDSGPVILGSSPSTPTAEKPLSTDVVNGFFCSYYFHESIKHYMCLVEEEVGILHNFIVDDTEEDFKGLDDFNSAGLKIIGEARIFFPKRAS